MTKYSLFVSFNTFPLNSTLLPKLLYFLCAYIYPIYFNVSFDLQLFEFLCIRHLFLLSLFIYFERERERASGGGTERERGRERESQAGCAVSGELDMGLSLTTLRS